MSNILQSVLALGLAGALAVPAQAQVLTEKALTANAATTIAHVAYETCNAQGYRVSVHVVGREGQVIAAIRGDGASPHTFENSFRKAYTARTFKKPSGEFAQQVKDNPNTPQIHLANVIALQGGLPIKVADDVIGAVGVSGAPGGDKDEGCAKAGLDQVAESLK